MYHYDTSRITLSGIAGCSIMTQNIIKPGSFTDGTYKRSKNKVVHTRVIELSRGERRAKKRGKRGCSCYGHKLTDLARYCVNVAAEHNAKSWSIYPIISSDAVYVDFHNWPEMGMCNFDEPVVRRKNYWWDERPVPREMTGNERDDSDKDGYFDPEA